MDLHDGKAVGARQGRVTCASVAPVRTISMKTGLSKGDIYLLRVLGAQSCFSNARGGI
jgi:hypothetical protein